MTGQPDPRRRPPAQQPHPPQQEPGRSAPANQYGNPIDDRTPNYQGQPMQQSPPPGRPPVYRQSVQQPPRQPPYPQVAPAASVEVIEEFEGIDEDRAYEITEEEYKATQRRLKRRRAAGVIGATVLGVLAALVVFALTLSEIGVPMFLRVRTYPAAVFTKCPPRGITICLYNRPSNNRFKNVVIN